MARSDVFLTGATGYAGPAVLAELVRSGRSVTALVREPTEIDGARTVVGVLGELQDMSTDIGEAEGIVHLASGRRLDRDRVLYEDIFGTGQLLDAWQRGPFVQSSTTTVHGVPRGVLDEKTPIDALVDWYDCGKVVDGLRCEQPSGRSWPDAVQESASGPRSFGPSRRRPVRQYLSAFYYHALEGRASSSKTQRKPWPLPEPPTSASRISVGRSWRRWSRRQAAPTRSPVASSHGATSSRRSTGWRRRRVAASSGRMVRRVLTSSAWATHALSSTTQPSRRRPAGSRARTSMSS